jgi:hypothetical protein
VFIAFTSSTSCGWEEMVEPLEETRSELVFATEPLLSSLYLAIPGSPYASLLVDLDEVEASGVEHQEQDSVR